MGVQFVQQPADAITFEYLKRAGYFLSFLFLLCGAARLARFNIQHNPIPKNPGRPDRKYFVGLPIPDETMLTFSGYLVFRGTLSLPMTLAVAFAGSVSGITLSYALGRFLGIRRKALLRAR